MQKLSNILSIYNRKVIKYTNKPANLTKYKDFNTALDLY